MLRFAKENGNGTIALNSKAWWAIKIIFTFCIGLAIASFSWGARTSTWTSGIARNKGDIVELRIENKEQDKSINDIKDIVIRIDERTETIKDAIEKIESKLGK